jgi:hypothetical protein
MVVIDTHLARGSSNGGASLTIGDGRSGTRRAPPGSNENTNGLPRQYLLRRVDFRTLTRPTPMPSPKGSTNTLDRPSASAVLGVSASAELALAMGLRHPQVFGAVFCASPGAGFQPPVEMPVQLPRAYIVAGTQGAVLPGERDPVGIGTGDPRRGRRDEGACWVARGRLLAAGVPAHGRVGLRLKTPLATHMPRSARSRTCVFPR